MEIIILAIEWFGVLFLSIEAIKVENFRNLTDKLINIKIALNPTFVYSEGNVFVPVAPKGYKILRKYSELICLVIGYLFLKLFLFKINFIFIYFEKIVNYLFSFNDILWYFVLLKLYLILFLFIAIPILIGNEFISLFSKFTIIYIENLYKLEEYTQQGIIGIIGFLLISFSFAYKFLNAL